MGHGSLRNDQDCQGKADRKQKSFTAGVDSFHGVLLGEWVFCAFDYQNENRELFVTKK
jgi:hypothetical protein